MEVKMNIKFELNFSPQDETYNQQRIRDQETQRPRQK